MFLKVMLFCIGLAALLGCLWAVGRRKLVRAIHANDKAAVLVCEFHQDLVRYANSNGEDDEAYRQMALNSAAVERALGYDNYVSGVRVGWYQMRGAPLLPLAIQEMRRHFSDRLWGREGPATAEVVQTVLLRHVGRREQRLEDLQQNISSVGACIASGWGSIAAVPIAVLEAFGLVSRRRGDAARESVLFRLWSLLLASALAASTFAGPIIGYLADRDGVDSEIARFWR